MHGAGPVAPAPDAAELVLDDPRCRDLPVHPAEPLERRHIHSGTSHRMDRFWISHCHMKSPQTEPTTLASRELSMSRLRDQPGTPESFLGSSCREVFTGFRGHSVRDPNVHYLRHPLQSRAQKYLLGCTAVPSKSRPCQAAMALCCSKKSVLGADPPAQA